MNQPLAYIHPEAKIARNVVVNGSTTTFLAILASGCIYANGWFIS